MPVVAGEGGGGTTYNHPKQSLVFPPWLVLSVGNCMVLLSVQAAHRLNIELDFQSLFGLLCIQLYSLAEIPQLPPFPMHLGSYMMAILVSQERRHLFVTPCLQTTTDQIQTSQSVQMPFIYLSAHNHCHSVSFELVQTRTRATIDLWIEIPLRLLHSISVAQCAAPTHIHKDFFPQWQRSATVQFCIVERGKGANFEYTLLGRPIAGPVYRPNVFVWE